MKRDTLRIISGAAAISQNLSFWLLAFSVFLFLSLAFVKRYAELQVHKRASGKVHEAFVIPKITQTPPIPKRPSPTTQNPITAPQIGRAHV